MFTGMGGLDLAVRTVFPDAEVAWHVEIDPAACALLEYRYPGVPNLGDITQLDMSALDGVDVLTAGYPCQPFSTAGRREGVEDERHLWPVVFDAIRTLRPQFTFIENVRGHLAVGFNEVLRDCASAGLDVRWAVVRAADVGAPHHRPRLFAVIADSFEFGLEARESRGELAASFARVARGGRPLSCDRFGWGESLRGRRRSVVADQFGRYADAILRWEETMGCAPVPVLSGARGERVMNVELPEWLMGLPRGFVSGVPGLSRKDILKILGNGVCPLQGAFALEQLFGVEY